jgi:hypothetical protein
MLCSISDRVCFVSFANHGVVFHFLQSASMFLDQLTMGYVTTSRSSPSLSTEIEALDGKNASKGRQITPAGARDANIAGTSATISGGPITIDNDLAIESGHSKWERPETSSAPFTGDENAKSVAGDLPSWALGDNIADFPFTDRKTAENSSIKRDGDSGIVMGQSADDVSTSDLRWCIKPVAGHHHSDESVPQTGDDVSLSSETRTCIKPVAGHHHSDESVPQTGDDVSLSSETRTCIKPVAGHHHSDESVPQTGDDVSLSSETRTCIKPVAGHHHSDESVPQTGDDVSLSSETRTCIKPVAGHHHSDESVPQTGDDVSLSNETRTCIKTVSGHHHTSESKSVAEQPHIKMVPSHNTNQESTESEQRLHIKMVTGKHVTDISDALNYVMGTHVAPTLEDSSKHHRDGSVEEATNTGEELVDSVDVESDVPLAESEDQKVEEVATDMHENSVDAAARTSLKSVTLKPSLEEPVHKPCIRVNAEHGATTESNVNQRSMQVGFVPVIFHF